MPTPPRFTPPLPRLRPGRDWGGRPGAARRAGVHDGDVAALLDRARLGAVAAGAVAAVGAVQLL